MRNRVIVPVPEHLQIHESCVLFVTFLFEQRCNLEDIVGSVAGAIPTRSADFSCVEEFCIRVRANRKLKAVGRFGKREVPYVDSPIAPQLQRQGIRLAGLAVPLGAITIARG